jgi:chemotaxis response regulator CheB
VEIVGTASTIGEARRALWERRPHVITLDLALPGEDGWDFLEYLANTSHAPVLVVSSSTTEGSPVRKNAIRLGAHACFDKARLVQDAALFMKTLRKAATKAYTTVE